MKKSGSKRTIRDPMACVMKRMPLADDQTRDLGLAYHISLDALLKGRGDEQAWSTVACALNIAMLLAEAGIEAAALPTILLAQEALLRVQERAQRTGKWVFDGDGIRVVLAAVNIHDEQISRATRGQVVSALDELKKRVNSGALV